MKNNPNDQEGSFQASDSSSCAFISYISSRATRAGSTAHVAAEGGGAVPVCGRSTPDAATEAAAICLPLLPGGLCLPDFRQMIGHAVGLPSQVSAQFFFIEVKFFLCKVTKYFDA